MEFKSIDFENLSIREKCNLIRTMAEKIIIHKNESHTKITLFIRINDLSRLHPFKRDNYLNNDNEQVSDAKMFVDRDRTHLIIEKSICFDKCHLSNEYLGRGKKFVTVAENSNNLIKALAIGWRYQKMAASGLSVRRIGEDEHKADRTIYRYLDLNFLSPNIVNAIMESQVPPHVNLQALFDIASKYSDFNDQEKAYYNEQ
jgi:hypothetical protein